MAHFITQQDADFFFEMEKFPDEGKEYQYPNSGQKLVIAFSSSDKRESFHFDIVRGSICMTKVTYQNRVRKAFVLRRLDLNGPTHVNPEVEAIPLPILEPYNGMEISTPHLHLYVEGYGEKWAIPAELLMKVDGKDIYEIMIDFFRYCNVNQLPKITKNIIDMKDLIESYTEWLKQKINYKEINGYYEVNTPFVNHVNDQIQFYLKRDSRDRIYMTDDGDTINNLEMAGVDVSTPARQHELHSILNGFGVILKGNELTILATPATFPMRKHNFIQAMLSIDDLFILASPKVESFFLDDVTNFLQQKSIRFSPNIILQGKSSFQHKFDFLIPASANAPERIIKAVASPRKQNIIAQLFAFEDTKLARNNEGIIILNDLEKEVAPEVLQAIEEYGINDFSWKNKEEWLDKLVA